MLKHPTIEKLTNLGLTGMMRALEQQNQLQDASTLSFEDRLALLVDAECSERDTTQFTKRLKAAKLRDSACVEDIDFKPNRGIDKRLIAQLAEGQWLQDHRNVLITGKTGVGKTYLACALGQKACRLNHSVLYFRAPRFFQELTVARLKNTYQFALSRLKKSRLLILDDFALVPPPPARCMAPRGLCPSPKSNAATCWRSQMTALEPGLSSSHHNCQLKTGTKLLQMQL